MASEIPADIRAKALTVSLCHQEPRGCVHPDDNSCEDGCELLHAIAQALLAERERCASTAEHLNGWGRDKGAGGHAMHIAKVIRQGNPNETEQGNG